MPKEAQFELPLSIFPFRLPVPERAHDAESTSKNVALLALRIHRVNETGERFRPKKREYLLVLVPPDTRFQVSRGGRFRVDAMPEELFIHVQKATLEASEVNPSFVIATILVTSVENAFPDRGFDQGHCRTANRIPKSKNPLFHEFRSVKGSM